MVVVVIMFKYTNCSIHVKSLIDSNLPGLTQYEYSELLCTCSLFKNVEISIHLLNSDLSIFDKRIKRTKASLTLAEVTKGKSFEIDFSCFGSGFGLFPYLSGSLRSAAIIKPTNLTLHTSMHWNKENIYVLVYLRTLQLVSVLSYHHHLTFLFRNSDLRNGRENQKDTSWFDYWAKIPRYEKPV